MGSCKQTVRLHWLPLLGSLPVRLSHPLLPSPVGRGHWVSHSRILHSVAHVETPRLGLAAMPSVATHCVLGQAVYGILWLPLGGDWAASNPLLPGRRPWIPGGA